MNDQPWTDRDVPQTEPARHGSNGRDRRDLPGAPRKPPERPLKPPTGAGLDPWGPGADGEANPEGLAPIRIPARKTDSLRPRIRVVAACGLVVMIGVGVAVLLAARGTDLQDPGSDVATSAIDSLPTVTVAPSTPSPTPAPTATPVQPRAPVSLPAVKAATVFIYAEGANGKIWSGSGALLSARHVLTNRHVAEGAETLLIAVSPTEDEPAQFRFSGRAAHSHPYLDVALIELVGSSDGSPFEVWGGEILPVASAAQLRAGDEVTALGFPRLTSIPGRDAEGRTRLPSVSVSRGQVVTFEIHPGCSTAVGDLALLSHERCSPEGDIDRGRILTDDLSGSGGSGGPVVSSSGLVAVRYAVRTPGQDTISTGGVAASVPVDLFLDWLLDLVG